MSEMDRDPPIVRDHRRQWRHCLYVYPVISRRAGGLSIGVNLNPDKRCNFACLYCQIDRRTRRGLHEVKIEKIRSELAEALSAATSGELWREERFAATPQNLRRINDIAFSGDGEPTCLPEFDQTVAAAADAKRQFGCDEAKIVVITNATQLDSPQVRRAMPVLDASNGEIWAKLDAGSEAYFRRVNRPQPAMTLDRVTANILAVARGREVVIQTLLLRLGGSPPPGEEIAAYCDRLRSILAAGGRIRLVQLHTVARPPQDPLAARLGDAELDAIAATVRKAVAPTPVETYYGQDVQSFRSDTGPSQS